MKEDRFNKMMEGVKQGAEILKGKRKPSRVFKMTVPIPDVKGIRHRLAVSQSEFAEMLGISVRTIQNWEQKRRVPDGPARILLELAAAHPNQVREVAHKVAKQRKKEREAAAGLP